MAGFFKKLAGLISESAGAFTNSDAAEAYIGGMVLAGSIDGDYDKDEQEQTLAMIGTNSRLKGFDTSEIHSRWVAKTNSSPIFARRDFIDLCAKVRKEPKQAEEVLIAFYEVICADGKIDAAEKELFDVAVSSLGVDLGRLGIKDPEVTEE